MADDYYGKMRKLKGEAQEEEQKKFAPDPSKATTVRGAGRLMVPSELGHSLPPTDQSQASTSGEREVTEGSGLTTVSAGTPKTMIKGRSPFDRSSRIGTEPKSGIWDPEKGPKLESLADYEGKQTQEYFRVGENVVLQAHGTDAASDFRLDEAAQVSFAQDAALKSFNQKDAQYGSYTSESRTIGGEAHEVFVFPDGSEYWVDPKVGINDLGSGDVVRIKPPEQR